VANGGCHPPEQEGTVSDPGLAPQRREFWVWVWSAIRPVFGWVLAALGALALFLGWYGVSGQALTAKQLPYLVSGGLTGIALVIIAGVVLATEDIRHQLSRVDDLERNLDDLYGLFVEELATPSGRGAAIDPVPTAAGILVALPAGSSYHRPDCALVSGKSDAVAVAARAIRARKLRPCRVCDPPAVG
jgi:hypothetical protein